MDIEEIKKQKIILLPVIMGLCLIISAAIWSNAYYNKDASNSLSVTGSASKDVTSDNAKFSGNFFRIVKISNLKGGYDQMSSDLVIVRDFLKAQGIDDKDVTISNVSMNENYKYKQNANSEKVYTL